MDLLGIDNVFFEVGDLEMAVTLYQRLGFPLRFKIPHIQGALFSIGREEPGLLLRERATPVPAKLWIEVVSAREAQMLFQEGTMMETATGWTFEVSDPWGNRVGFADYTKKRELARRQT